MNTPPDAPAIAQEGPQRPPQAQSGPYALIEALTAELRAVRAERDRAVAVVGGMLPIFDAFTQDELSVTTIDEAIALLPEARALLASMNERSSNRGVEGV